MTTVPKLGRVAWCLDGRNPYWTLAHLTLTDRVTLCGRPIPQYPFDKRYGAAAEGPYDPCQICERKRDRSSRTLKLSPMQQEAWDAIKDEPGITIETLAVMLQTTVQGAVRVVVALSRKGIAYREYSIGSLRRGRAHDTVWLRSVAS